jgi:hypothetical protein
MAASVMRRCVNMQKLDVADCAWFSTPFVESTLRAIGWLRLHELNASGTYLGLNCVMLLLKNVISLRNLDVSRCTLLYSEFAEVKAIYNFELEVNV